MCGQLNRCGSTSRCARQARQESGSSSGCGCCDQGWSCGCGCGCDNMESAAPTATISMADYESFILVPTSVFDQGDTDCGCSRNW